MDWQVREGGGQVRMQQTWADPHHGLHWGGTGIRGEVGVGVGISFFGGEGDCAAPAALLVSSVADTCSATALQDQHTVQPGEGLWGGVEWGGGCLACFSSPSLPGPAAHQWCLCCSSGGHLLAESESRSTLGMELSSPRYQDCGERTGDRRQETLAITLATPAGVGVWEWGGGL